MKALNTDLIKIFNLIKRILFKLFLIILLPSLVPILIFNFFKRIRFCKLGNISRIGHLTSNSERFYYFCKKTGQVVQRQFGFAKAKHDLVLQIDDDIIFANKDIFKLIQFKKILKNSSIGPIYYDNNKNKIHKLDKSFFGYFKRFLHWVILSVPLTSLRMGKISKIHTNYGVDPKYMKRDFLSCDWLPGGLILHEKKNLVLKNYYPFKGKAIGEDILHSKILRQKGIKLYVIKKSSVFTNPQENTNREFVKKYFKFLNYINIKRLGFIFGNLYFILVLL